MAVFLIGGLMLNHALAQTQSKTSTPDPGSEPSPTPTSRENLSDYARGHDLRTSSQDRKTPVVITDENLKGLAGGVELTSVTTTGNVSVVPNATVGQETLREQWRAKVKAQIEIIRSIEKHSVLLKREISDLWDMFYASDDPIERERSVRPRLIDKLDEPARLDKELQTARAGLENLLKEARRSGALPGWFRDLMNEGKLKP